jgi:AraC-like DNA-binding protein
MTGTLTGSVPAPPQTPAEGHTVPASVLAPLVEVVKHWGVRSDELLGPLGLREEDVSAPLTRFPQALYHAIIERARMLTGEPGLGFFWGMQMRISLFGHLGLAAMCAATLRDAIELAIEFASLGSTAEGMRLQVDGDIASLILDEYVDFGSVRDVVTIARLTGLWRIAEAITKRDLHATADIAFPEPPYHARIANQLPMVRYGQPTTRVLFKTGALSYPLVLADPVAARFATEQCKKQLSAFSAGERLVRTVRSVLWKPDGRLRSSPEVARAISMSTRTLRRRLRLQGRSLSSLIDEERRDRALLLLRGSDVSTLDVAERVGYRTVQSFERAFRRWTGATPAEYRRSRRS